MGESVQLARQGAIARLVISAPQRKNALSVAMWRMLTQHLHALSTDAHIRAIVLSGEGADFCAGAHIGEFAQERYDSSSAMRYHEEIIRPALQTMLSCDKPLIAAIRGHCVGGGLELAACCDVRITDDSAQFGVPVLHRGFSLAPFEMACVLQAFGRSAITQLLFEGAIIPAAQALRLNLIHHLASPANFDQMLNTILARVLAAAPGALAQSKQLMRRVLYSAALAAEPNAQDYALLDSSDYQEGVAAFLEKRTPQFSGT
jgi:enoyl-CoA hydratase